MKIQFKNDLDYQQDAISSITDIFKGQEVCESNFTVFSPEYIEKQVEKQVKGRLKGHDSEVHYSKEDIKQQ